ncbi:MAG: family efflux transporter [Clostridia bacterium]|jgi:putative MATE family efflux protein|nr:family efflux transporter [Clostridia bacterium]
MSEKAAIRDLTQGNMMKNMLVFSLPMLFGNVLQNLYNWVDSIIVGNYLGYKALAAVNIAFPIMFILTSVVLGLTMATSILVSQYAGAQDEKMIKRTIGTTNIFLAVAAIIIAIIGIVFSRSFLLLVNTPPEIMADAQSYLIVIMIGLIFTFGYNMTSAVLRGLGDSVTPTKFLIISTVLNAVLDIVLVLGLGPIPSLGVAGAAWATIIAQGTSYILSIIYLRKKGHLISFKFSELTFDKRIMKLILKLGVPAATQQFIVSSGHLALSGIINSFGADVIAGFGAGSKIDSFAMLPAMTLSITASTVTGQCIGAGMKHRVKDVLKSGAKLSVIISSAIILFIYTLGRPSLHLFTQEAGVIDIGVQYLKIVSLSYIFLGLNFVFVGILRGAGEIWINTIITFMSFFGLRVPLAAYLSSIPALGSKGIWIGIAISFTFGFIANGSYYATGRWKRKEIIRAGRPLAQRDASLDMSKAAIETMEASGADNASTAKDE